MISILTKIQILARTVQNDLQFKKNFNNTFTTWVSKVTQTIFYFYFFWESVCMGDCRERAICFLKAVYINNLKKEKNEGSFLKSNLFSIIKGWEININFYMVLFHYPTEYWKILWEKEWRKLPRRWNQCCKIWKNTTKTISKIKKLLCVFRNIPLVNYKNNKYVKLKKSHQT